MSNSILFVRGSIHQGDSRFSDISRGTQWNSTTFGIKHTTTKNWMYLGTGRDGFLNWGIESSILLFSFAEGEWILASFELSVELQSTKHGMVESHHKTSIFSHYGLGSRSGKNESCGNSDEGTQQSLGSSIPPQHTTTKSWIHLGAGWDGFLNWRIESSILLFSFDEWKWIPATIELSVEVQSTKHGMVESHH